MHIIDWIILVIPVLVVVYIGLKTQRYVRDVSDFLAAGRVAGRYVLAVAAGESNMGLISFIGMYQFFYVSGLGLSFWQTLATPISIFIALTGFAVYRYRETRAMTLGQFFEMRYNKSFRLLAAIIITTSGLVNYGLFPAVSARFIIYYLNLPTHMDFFGITIPMLAVAMLIFLSVALFITTLGGQLTVMVTDCIIGIISCPVYLIIAAFLLIKFPWFKSLLSSLEDCSDGMSLINPYDIENLRNFNLFFVFTNLLSFGVYNIISWQGAQGYNAAALNAHEAKMGRILGRWRGGYVTLMIILVGIGVHTFVNNPSFKTESVKTERHIRRKALNDITANMNPGNEIVDEGEFNIRVQSLDPKKKHTYEQTIDQMRLAVTMRTILPVGLTGAFLSVMVFMMISTDTTYAHSWGSIIVQDIILPFKKSPFAPRRQLFVLRISIACVIAFAFLWSLSFAQVTYVMMFFAITGTAWLGGAGAVIIGGLYWSRGTAKAAWLTTLVSVVMSVIGFVGIHYWSNLIWPFLEAHPCFLNNIKVIVEGVSKPFEPVIVWRVNEEGFPMNAQEVFLITIILCITVYIITSLLTCKEKFNMDRLLHRGKYQRKEDMVSTRTRQEVRQKKFTSFLKKNLLGIDKKFSKSDKLISLSVFYYWVCYAAGVPVIVMIWNIFSPWPGDWWGVYFFVTLVVMGCIIGVISTVWFLLGGIIDLRRLFRRLALKEENILDDGRVIGHISADEVAIVEEIEHSFIKDNLESGLESGYEQ